MDETKRIKERQTQKKENGESREKAGEASLSLLTDFY